MLFKWFSRLLHTVVFLAFLYIFSSLFAPILVEASPIPTVFINEIHYDNSGIDQGEFIELAGMAGLNLDGWSLHFYNGNNGNEYKKYTFSDWLLNDTANGFGFAGINISGIQNGSPDGIVLADAQDNIIQFLSYEGVFTANSGIAAGLTSIDIGVSEFSDTSVGFSLQLIGQGKQYSDFIWAASKKSTFGVANFRQTLNIDTSSAVSINEPSNLVLFCLALLFLFLSPLKAKQVT
ncbi:MAG: lamin tail domain-containing protein [Colwellia sp.]|nr:lamin tail domain-containing protein [Colwellia sp.]